MEVFIWRQCKNAWWEINFLLKSTQRRHSLLSISNPFVCEVLSTWAVLQFSDVAAISDANVGDRTIWLNSPIWIENRPVFHKDWLGHGVWKLSHLLEEGGNLIGYDVMTSNFQELNRWHFCSIVSAVIGCKMNQCVKWIILKEWP